MYLPMWLSLQWFNLQIGQQNYNPIDGCQGDIPDNKVHVVNMGPTWVLVGPGGPYVGPVNLAVRDALSKLTLTFPSGDQGAPRGVHAGVGWERRGRWGSTSDRHEAEVGVPGYPARSVLGKPTDRWRHPGRGRHLHVWGQSLPQISSGNI